MTKEFECVKYVIDDEGIAWVMFNRPEKRNAMNPQLHYDMESVITELETDYNAKVIVITGSGEAWSAGMDLREYFRATDSDPAARFKSFWAHRHWSQYISVSQKASIAMVNGYCFGGAFCSLAACDIVVAADDATFGLSEINWGILPGGNVSKVFADLANHRNAMFYAMTGRTFNGPKAVEMGIATLSVPADQLRDEVLAIARELMEKEPVVLAYTKHAVRNVGDMNMDMAYEYLATKGLALRFADQKDTRGRGMTEFLDKKSYRPGLGPVNKEDC